MARRKTRFSALSADARAAGYLVAKHSPGDGVTRYGFFKNAKPGQTFFGPGDPDCVAMGLARAKKFLQTGRCPRTRSRR